MKQIPLKGKYGEGLCAKISDVDFDFVKTLSLYLNNGYVKTYYQGRHWKLHQLLIGNNIDHINRDKLDNQRENLRPATQQQQNVNTKTRSKSGLRGVYKDSTSSKFRAGITVNGKWVNLGSFQDPHYAALIVDLWSRDLHGEFSTTNFSVVSDGR